MKHFLHSTYTKGLIFISISAVLTLMLFSILYYYTKDKEHEVYIHSKKQFSNEMTALVDLKSESLKSAVIDYTYWDEFVYFIEVTAPQKKFTWFEQNVATIISSINIDYLITYNLKREVVAERKSDAIQSTNFLTNTISNTILDDLYKKKITSFYLQIPEGVLEFHCATIHPFIDPSKTKTQPRGYFLIAKLLNKQYFKTLEAISSSTITVLNPGHAKAEASTNFISFSKALKDYNNTPIKTLVFKRPFSLNYQTTIHVILIIVVFFLFNLFSSVLFLRKMVHIPLNLIKRILLRKHNEKDLATLQKFKGEFKEIGILFQKSIDFKNKLITAKNKAEESDLLKSAFLTNLSHEIRTPMNAIIGFTDIIETEKLTDQERNEYFQIIKKSGRNLVSIIDDLIDMSKIDTDITKPKLKPFYLSESLEDIYNSVKITIPKEKHIKLVLVPPKTPLKQALISDEVKLKQTIVNLLNNAIKFSNEGNVTFGYNISTNNMLIFTVKDTGIGIIPEEQENVFNRFKRVHADETIDTTGLGLGLSICKAYVEMLGGEISVSSEKDIGSTFTFTIPLRLDISPSENKKTKLKKSVANQKALTILVAEDDNINFMLVKRILITYNHTIIRAKNGQEAVDICKENKNIDLILMDLKMPKLTGMEAFKQIKPMRPLLPVIAHTAYSSHEDKEQIFEAGFTDCVTKPLDKVKLLNAIDKIFNVQEPAL